MVSENIDHLNNSADFENRISIREMHEEMNEYKATKKTVNDLLNYKRSLIDIENSDFDKINEIKGKAIDAINNLFNDIINTKK
ncbi:hypothetical protein CNR22_22415 [Sphingobacteriaceae bacterium]|nr:hypothetical protein CNR22_22415 [Sphingobacteriaceae bacterium]